IARLAAALRAPAPARPSADDAVKTTRAAAQSLTATVAREADPRQQEAVSALNRLADALPDIHQRRQPTRQALDEARRKADEVAREVERHVRETAPQPGRPFDPDTAAADLARRVA